jgi:hypothetical protein
MKPLNFETLIKLCQKATEENKIFLTIYKDPKHVDPYPRHPKNPLPIKKMNLLCKTYIDICEREAKGKYVYYKDTLFLRPITGEYINGWWTFINSQEFNDWQEQQLSSIFQGTRQDVLFYLDKPLSKETIEMIMKIMRGNPRLQPWKESNPPYSFL